MLDGVRDEVIDDLAQALPIDASHRVRGSVEDDVVVGVYLSPGLDAARDDLDHPGRFELQTALAFVEFRRVEQPGYELLDA